MALFERDFAKEVELVDDLLNGLNYELIPTIVDAAADADNEYDYLYEIEAYHDSYKARKVVRDLLIRALEGLPKEGYMITTSDGHKWYEYSIGGQFDVTVAYNPDTCEYDGDVHLGLIQYSTW